jgi:hypothetical protein
VLIQHIWVRDLHSDLTGDDLFAVVQFELKCALFWKNALKRPGQALQILMQVFLAEPVHAAPNFADIMEANHPVAEFKVERCLVSSQRIEECAHGRPRSWIDVGHGIGQLVIRLKRALEQFLGLR